MKKYFNYGEREENLLKSYEETSGDKRYKDDLELREFKLQELKYLDMQAELDMNKPSILNLFKNRHLHPKGKEER